MRFLAILISFSLIVDRIFDVFATIFGISSEVLNIMRKYVVVRIFKNLGRSCHDFGRSLKKHISGI